MDFNRPWTVFAVDAEIEEYGTVRICDAANRLRAEVETVIQNQKTFSLGGSW